jgi:hypothetical protein
VLEGADADPDQIRAQVEEETGNEARKDASPSLAPDAKRTLLAAYEEAQALSSSYIGPEHVLLALADDEEGEAGKLLSRFGLSHTRLRGAVAASWPKKRRVVYKAEVLQKGTNRRLFLTTRNEEPKALYEFYAQRGEWENWIKDFKLHVKADRLSCHRFIANQFRLLVHAAAYWLMDALWRKLIASGSRRMQLDTVRLRLIKIGGRVRELLTKVRLHLASGHPGQSLWNALSGAFGGVHE